MIIFMVHLEVLVVLHVLEMYMEVHWHWILVDDELVVLPMVC